ncbi:MAG: hypothetical protein PWR03_2262 [Tenuifilum sp.]|jgi:hypothetical protein|uniref:hypothetical protein n=1 Tax=Tenuifilum sp. TaxID=2760880 RepID=UPI0024AA5CFC|nr:hypothetical protein [Tenuifilum sp.]MDI3528078.1 hypothetical protein [Tenuifilum sp.]
MANINQISDYFTKVDSNVVEILSCAANDFLSLNNRFKEAHKGSTYILENAEKIISIYSSSFKSENIINLKDLSKKISTLKESYSQIGSNALLLIKEISGTLDGIELQRKNISQNLLTQKFLLSNLKISEIGSNKLEEKNEDSDYIIEFNRLINRAKLFEQEQLKLLKGNKEALEEVYNKTQKGIKQIESNLDAILKTLKKVIELFSEKQQELNISLPKLQENNSRLRENIDSIITNLQYHDIIRQKVEHVQQSHKELLKNLKKIDENTDDKFLMQVKEIVNIQSALLVRANKEYQTAIEKIVTRFKSIGSISFAILIQCQSLTKNKNIKVETDILAVTDRYANLIKQNSHNVVEQAKDVSQILSDSLIKLDNSIIDEIIQYSSRYVEMISHPEFSLQTNLIEQFNTVQRDITASQNLIQILNLELSDKVSGFEKLLEILVQNAKTSRSDDISIELKRITDKMLENEEEVLVLLNKNKAESERLENTIESAISDIKYYEVFEVKIVEIIKILQKIYKNLSGKSDTQLDKDELNFIRTMYTMDAERQIHDQVINGDHDINDSNIDEEDNDVEFF